MNEQDECGIEVLRWGEELESSGQGSRVQTCNWNREKRAPDGEL